VDDGSVGCDGRLGAGAINASLNTYVAEHIGEGLMQWLHASYGTVWILPIVHKITGQINQENAL